MSKRNNSRAQRCRSAKRAAGMASQGLYQLPCGCIQERWELDDEPEGLDAEPLAARAL